MFPIFFVVLALMLTSCEPASGTVYRLHNFSAKPIMAVTMDVNGGGPTVAGHISDKGLGIIIPRKRIWHSASVKLQWIAGAGRASWQQVALPVKIEQFGGENLEVYFRPDGLVCASLVDLVSDRSEEIMLARIKMASTTLSCAKPVTLPPLAPGMVHGFNTKDLSSSWEHPNSKSNSTSDSVPLFHTTGQVMFKDAYPYRGEVGFDAYFKSVRLIGKNSAILIDPGLYVVTGDATGWQSRFLGGSSSVETRFSPTRVMFGKDVILDIATADIFLMPHLPAVDYWVLGQSLDGKHLAIYWQEKQTLRADGAGTVFNFTMIRLEDGVELEGDVTSLPPLPPNENIELFYTRWYKDHCVWTPLLRCK